GDSIANSGRPRSERYAELFDYVKEPLCTYLAGNMRNVMSLQQRGWTLVINMLKPNVNVSLKTAAFSALAHILTETFLPGEPLIPCDRTAARSQRVVLLKLLSMDEQQEDLTLSAVIAETLPARVLAKCVYDDQGCCVLYYMLSFLERSGSQGHELRGLIDMEFLQKSETPGAAKLLGLLQNTQSMPPFQ
ncbi:CPL protein, partial [Aphelenchoides avenae]